MKTRILILSAAFAFFAAGCNNDDDSNPTAAVSPMNQSDVKANQDMDDISDDVTQIAESQSDEATAGRGNDPGFLAQCGFDIDTNTSGGTTWVRTLNFGETNCTLWNGNRVRGKIILTFNTDWTAQTRTITYAFENFYHNDRRVEGNRTVVRRILENGHPQATIDLNLTVTLTDGTVYNRVGQKVREFTAGHNTWPILLDNEFAYTGAWVTTNVATGVSYTTTINTPLIVKWNCPNIVQGTVTLTRSVDNTVATIDYGDGACDDNASLTINGFTFDISL